MSGAPLTPVEAARVLWQIGEEIQAKTDELIAERKKYPGLMKARREAFVTTFMTTDGAMDYRRRAAEKAALDAQFEEDLCEQAIESLKDKLRELRDRSEIGRSINSNLKEELRTLGVQP